MGRFFNRSENSLVQAYIIVDLGFGDAGKGLVTDFLVRRTGADLVVRYNGGAQAGHNVVTPDGRHHTFAQFGSGAFLPGVRTYLSRHVIVHPTALLVEGDTLATKGVPDVYQRLRISEDALVITPYHQAANRIRELLRGDARHGSCGVGVGETVEHALAHPEDCIRAGDLNRPAELRHKLTRIRDHKWTELRSIMTGSMASPSIAREMRIYEDIGVIDAWIGLVARIASLGLVVPDSVLETWLKSSNSVVFEGAQGVLLDAEAGFHPYTTWSDCTTANALAILSQMVPGVSVKRVGVMRAYMVRHGPGPLPTETRELEGFITEHNQYGDWQRAVRYGWLDAVLLRYALALTGGVDSIALTHLDLLPKLKTFKFAIGYEGYRNLDGTAVDRGLLSKNPLQFLDQRGLDPKYRARMTDLLMRVTPCLDSCEPDELKVIGMVGALIGKPVEMISSGPSADQVKVINPTV
ncbi:MAG TPA: adenylosuccinate synthetase [Longilinea sp.]|nr:adenylosuccinate synthetase [Longilinea sp.]